MKIVYTLPNCPKCEQLKQELTDKHEEFETRDAREHLDKFRKLGVSHMPYVEEE